MPTLLGTSCHQIRREVKDGECFGSQNFGVLEHRMHLALCWILVQQVVALITKSPLRPCQELGLYVSQSRGSQPGGDLLCPQGTFRNG